MIPCDYNPASEIFADDMGVLPQSAPAHEGGNMNWKKWICVAAQYALQ